MQLNNLDQPTLIIIRGLPGSGKTYLANTLAKKFSDEQRVELDPDAVNQTSEAYQTHTKKLTAEGVESKIHLYRFLREKAFQAILEKKVIIWNQPFSNLEIFNRVIASLEGFARQNNTDLHVVVVEVAIDEATAKQRVEQRKKVGGHGPSDNTFARFMNDYHSFKEHGYDVLVVDGTDDVANSVTKIIEFISGR